MNIQQLRETSNQLLDEINQLAKRLRAKRELLVETRTDLMSARISLLAEEQPFAGITMDVMHNGQGYYGVLVATERLHEIVEQTLDRLAAPSVGIVLWIKGAKVGLEEGSLAIQGRTSFVVADAANTLGIKCLSKPSYEELQYEVYRLEQELQERE